MRLPVLALLVVSVCPIAAAQDVANVDRQTQDRLKAVMAALSEAQKTGNETEVRRQVKQSVVLLGSQAGLPEVADEYRAVPVNARPLSADELPTAFDPYIVYIERQKWWRIGLDPRVSSGELKPASEGRIGQPGVMW